MKFLSSLYLTVFFSSLIIAQSDPNVSTFMKYEEVPVDLSNGIPDVNVPFVNIPTRSKDVSVDISLKYHPLNDISNDSKAGDCGLGWNLFSGGVISRTIIGINDASTYYYSASSPNNVLNDDIYQFNFMGYYGRFILYLKSDHTIGLKVIKQKNSKLDLKFEYDSHFEITSFTFFDEKGNQYLFNIINNSNHTNNAYYLSSIVDNNNKELVHFDYQSCFTPAVINVSSSKTYNKLTEIRSSGFGKITLTYPDIATNCTNARLTELVLSDAKNNAIKKMKLFGTQYKIYKIQISDISEVKKEIYKFTYNNPHGGTTTDSFGYKTSTPCGLSNNSIGVPSLTLSKSNVLIKMILPTGGSIVYDYEPNSYSYYTKNANGIWQVNQDSNLYYENLFGGNGNGENNRIPLIPENFIVNNVGSGPFPVVFTNSNTTYNFTIPSTAYPSKVIYFKLHGNSYGIPNIHDSISVIHYPTFKLSTITPYGQVHYFIHFGESGYYEDNSSGLCLGQKYVLSPGNYTVTINSTDNQHSFGTLEIKTLDLNPNPRKWFYGGGIRIKQIGYFTNNAPFDYYNSTQHSIAQYNSQGFIPVSEKKFDYNFFNTPNSSGYLVNSDFNIINQDDELGIYSKLYFGGYKNVTITDSQNNGREEYIFKDGLDPIDTSVSNGLTIFEDSKKGLLLNKKTYDSNGNLLKTINFNYDFSDPETDGGVSINYPFVSTNYPQNFPTSTAPLLEIGKLTQKTTTDYFGTQAKSVTEYFGYDPVTFQLKEHTATNSLGETLKTEYVYDTNNSPFSQNRISEPSQTKTYRAGSLLSTNKVNYSSNLFGNQSYLPQTIEYARGTGNLEVKKRFNQYDDYSNLLEEQQENGIITSYIWGYNNTVIVAKLDNISYSNIPYNLILSIQSATNSTTASETDVINAQNALRTSTDVNLQKAMITTFTYRPFIGISTVTDIKGDKIFYEYDELGRLMRVRDKDSNILSETQYNLINQN